VKVAGTGVVCTAGLARDWRQIKRDPAGIERDGVWTVGGAYFQPVIGSELVAYFLT